MTVVGCGRKMSKSPTSTGRRIPVFIRIHGGRQRLRGSDSCVDVIAVGSYGSSDNSSIYGRVIAYRSGEDGLSKVMREGRDLKGSTPNPTMVS